MELEWRRVGPLSSALWAQNAHTGWRVAGNYNEREGWAVFSTLTGAHLGWVGSWAEAMALAEATYLLESSNG